MNTKDTKIQFSYLLNESFLIRYCLKYYTKFLFRIDLGDMKLGTLGNFEKYKSSSFINWSSRL